MSGQDIQFPSNGSSAMGYLARPAGNDPKPGVVVIQEWWGLNDHIRDVTNRIAAAGFVALAPDLYHGKVVTEPNDAQKAAMELDRERAMKEIDGAVAYLKGQSFVAPKKIGVIGFCMGGGLALWNTARNADIGAVAAFYGGGAPDTADKFTNAKAAILNIVGDQDSWVVNSIKPLAEGLKARGITSDIVIYPGAQHAFFNDARKEVYKADAAQDAWKRACDWFNKYLVA